MYKLLIVDDEAIIREGIINNVDFKAIGLQLVGSCENGVDALEVVKESQPDIVMTDINMPFMDGMTLAENILDLYPLTKIVFLTGYDKFEYAHHALKLKVSDYLVKPVLPKELKEVFQKVIHSIEVDQAEEEVLGKLRSQLKDTVPVMRERFLNRLIKWPIEQREIDAKFKSFDMRIEGRFFQLLCLTIQNTQCCEFEFNQLDKELTNMFIVSNNILEGINDSFIFRSYNDEVIILVASDTDNDLLDLTTLISEKLEEASDRYYNINLSIGIGKVCRSIGHIHKSYESALSSLDYRFFKSTKQVVSYYDIHEKTGMKPLSLTAYGNQLYKALKNGTKESIDCILTDVFKELEEATLPIDNIYIHVQHILTSIMLSLEEQGISNHEIFGSSRNPSVTLYEYETLTDIKEWMFHIIELIIARVIKDRSDYQLSQAKKTIRYVEDHFNEHDMSLKKVCKALSMSVSYFSLLFKEETGTTFVDYLTNLRMERAKELLRNTNKKTYEVADQVGYKDSHYFSLVFKKQVGMTATAFRDTMR